MTSVIHKTNNMETKIPKTKQEAFAQLDEMLSGKDKRELANGDANRKTPEWWKCQSGV